MASWDERSPLPASAQQLVREVTIWAGEEPLPSVASPAAAPSMAAHEVREAIWRQQRSQAGAEPATTATAVALRALRRFDAAVADVQQHVNAAMTSLDVVGQRFNSLNAESSALQGQAADVLAHKASLSAFDAALEVRLGPFRVLATHRQYFDAPNLSVDSEGFEEALDRLDEAIARLGTSATALKETQKCMADLRQLQCRGLRVIVGYFSRALGGASAQAHGALRTWLADERAGGETGTESAGDGGKVKGRGGLITPDDAAFLNLAHVKFQTLAMELRPWIDHLERRATQHKASAQVMADAHSVYLTSRANLLRAALGPMLFRLLRANTTDASAAAEEAEVPSSAVRDAAASVHPSRASDVASRACSWFARVCTMEAALFADFFPRAGAGGAFEGRAGTAGSGAAASAAARLTATMDGVCSLLLGALRTLALHTDPIESLCDLVLTLQAEVPEAIRASGRGAPTKPTGPLVVAAIAPLQPLLERLVGEVQARIAFKAQTFSRDHIRAYRLPAGVDYPACLQTAAAPGASPGPGPASGGPRARTPSPPVERCLRCLAQLYRCIDRASFTSLAHELVADTTASLLRAGASVSASAGALHGRLFLVMELLVLREQIAPFEVDFLVREKTLDFSNLRGQLLANLSSPSALVRPGALVRSVLSGGRLQVVESERVRVAPR